jgi:hypothetical protein
MENLRVVYVFHNICQSKYRSGMSHMDFIIKNRKGLN